MKSSRVGVGTSPTEVIRSPAWKPCESAGQVVSSVITPLASEVIFKTRLRAAVEGTTSIPCQWASWKGSIFDREGGSGRLGTKAAAVARGGHSP